jgi:hypothetical protein
MKKLLLVSFVILSTSLNTFANDGQDSATIPACNLNTAQNLAKSLASSLLNYSIQADNVEVNAQLSQTGVDGSVFNGNVSISDAAGNRRAIYDITIIKVGNICVLDSMSQPQGD